MNVTSVFGVLGLRSVIPSLIASYVLDIVAMGKYTKNIHFL